MPISFFDIPEEHVQLYPLTMTRPSSELRVGILKIREKWEKHLGTTTLGHLSVNHLSAKFDLPPGVVSSYWINGNCLPSPSFVKAIKSLPDQSCLTSEGRILAAKGKATSIAELENFNAVELEVPVDRINRTWDIFLQNGKEILADFELITSGRNSQPISDPNTVFYGNDIFIEEGVKIKASILNAEEGPIYLGSGAEISEGSIIRGPFAALDNCMISMGAQMRPNTTIGPYSRAGGEVSNSVIQGYSSKGHGGFLGNAVLGEWCNLGADTNNSNLKNNYKQVKMWDYATHSYIDTGLQFCGLVMGDHAKAAIDTMFSTGTTVGVNANIFGAGFQSTYIPSFSWGMEHGIYQIEKALETADLVMARRSKSLTQEDIDILRHIYNSRLIR